MRKLALLAALALTCLPQAGICQNQDTYRHYFEIAEREKKAGNFAGMEAALKSAFQHGAGDEYAWRSLAWAQARQGKWKESLQNAWENIRRNGECAWSLRQLFDSAIVAGDLELARDALTRAEKLPENLRNADISSDKKLIADLTATRVFAVEWKVDAKQGGAAEKPVRILMPHGKHLWQTFDYKVENAVSWKKAREDDRELLEVVQKPGEPFVIKGTITHRPFVLGAKRLSQVPTGACPESLKSYLGPFKNRVSYDPSLPEVLAVARELKGRTSAETVQNVLDWLHANMKYEDGHSDDLKEILKSHHGVCHHYSNLMVTLCRAAGVPAVVAHGVKIPTEGQFTNHGGSHGWVEVYLNSIGWVPVEPLNVNSLRTFGSVGYVFFDTSGHSPEDDHFRFTSLQGYHVDGKVMEVKTP